MNNILSLLEAYAQQSPDDIAMSIAHDFRRRRLERAITREKLASAAGIPVANLIRFEQKGLISLKNLIALSMELGYIAELKDVFSKQKYSTMEELTMIRKNATRKRGHK